MRPRMYIYMQGQTEVKDNMFRVKFSVVKNCDWSQKGG
jgi:hypothetical protein